MSSVIKATVLVAFTAALVACGRSEPEPEPVVVVEPEPVFTGKP